MAIVAKAANKPFYVAVESYKFVRFFPLNQYDLPPGVTSTLNIIFDDKKDSGHDPIPAKAEVFFVFLQRLYHKPQNQTKSNHLKNNNNHNNKSF